MQLNHCYYMVRLLLLIVLHICVYSSLSTQPQRVERIGVAQGLNSTRVISISQDPEGYIWVATKRGGLLRYDGHNFVPFKWEGEFEIETAEHYFVDSKGYRYVSTENDGIIRISPSGSYKIYKTNDRGEGLYLPSVFEDRDNNIWFLSYGQGLSLLDPVEESLKTYMHDPNDSNSISDDELYKIVQDEEGFIWIATEKGGLSRFDYQNESFYNYTHDPEDVRSIPGDKVYGIELDHTGLLWITIYGRGVASFDKESEQFKLYKNEEKSASSLSSNLVWPLSLDGENGLYIGTQDHGLDYLSFETMQFSNINFDPNDETSMTGNRIVSLFVDRESNLWSSSDIGGISFYNSSKDVFQRIAHDPFDSQSIKSNSIRYIDEDEFGNIWISYDENGVERIDKRTGEITHFATTSRKRQSLTDDNTMHMLCDQNGSVWIGTKFGGINRINTTTLDVSQYRSTDEYPQNGPYSNWIFFLYVDGQGDLWLSSSGGLSKYVKSKNVFEHIELDGDRNNKSTPAGTIVQSLTGDTDGNLWIKSELGFEILDTKTESFRLTTHDFSPLYNQEDRMWYFNQGVLSKFNLITEQTSDYKIEESIIVNSAVEGPLGDVWLSCNDGIRKLDIRTKEVRLMNEEDGLVSNQFVQGGFCSNVTGQLYFNSPKGINVFHPNDIAVDSFLPDVKIVSLTYLDSKSNNTEPTPYEDIEEVSSITLPYHYNIINIGYASLSYKKPKKNLYQYRIKELGDRWINLGTDRNLTFTNLSPQEYNLELKGSNGDGVWNNNPTTLKIIITPPWYASWWAYMLYGLITFFVIWQYIRWREREQYRKLNEEKRVVERLKEVDRLKDVFLANTSHELRTPLNGIIGLSESLRDGISGDMSVSAVSNLNMIINSGKRLAHLVNDILDFSKLKNHDLSLDVTAVDLQSAVDLVVALSKPSIGSKSLKIYNYIENTLPLVEADENRLQQILHNLIGNAIKFTKKGSVKISADHKEDKIWISISDTGIGIPEDKLDSIFTSFDQVDSSIERQYGGTGLGLSISKQLIEQHGGTISVSSKQGEGTQVTFSLNVSSVSRADRAFVKRNEEKLVPIKEFAISEKTEVEEQTTRDTGNVQILVVDDEPVNRQVLANFLKLEGYVAHLAEDGYAALDILSKYEINLILLDVMMPGMSGYQVAKQVRKSYLPSILPIIMLTSKNGINDLVTGFNSGANDYLAKPFVRKELVSRIQNHLNLQRIIRTSAQFVPDDFIKSLGRESISDVQLGDFTEKVVTVLFTDIRNYTGLSEKMTPKDNFEFVRSYVSKMGPIIQKNNGFVNQYLGDGIMCIFDQGPMSALNAAIEMQEEVAEYNRKRVQDNRVPIEVGMGFCTGPLVMGIIGDAMRKDSTTIASSVNLASRFEGLTKVLGAKILFDRNSDTESIDHYKWNIRSIGLVRVRGQQGEKELLECFGTDDVSHIDAKRESLDDFNKAIYHLSIGEKEKCLLQLEAIIEKYPSDRVVEYLIGHIANDKLIESMESNRILLDFG